MKERLKSLRKSLNLTQAEFAKHIGLKQNTIATYEMGRSIPNSAAINNICKEFRIREDWLRTGEGEMRAESTRAEEIAASVDKFLQSEPPEFRKRLVELLVNLHEDDWEKLEKFAEYLVEDKRRAAAENPEPTPPETTEERIQRELREYERRLRKEAEEAEREKETLREWERAAG